jgi:hypothetical protein
MLGRESKCLQSISEETKETGGESTGGNTTSGRSTVARVLGRCRAGSVGSKVASRPGSLGLTVGDLRDNPGSGASLGLTVRYLRDDPGGRASLGLPIRNLRDNLSGRRSLGLPIRNLRDNLSGRRSLGLTVRYLRDDLAGGGGCLGLAIGDLGDSGLGGSVWLTVAHLRGATALIHSHDEDGATLRTGALTVQVVEVAREALVEDGAATKCERAVTAKGEA